MGDVYLTDFNGKTFRKLPEYSPPTVFVWECSFCLQTYSWTKDYEWNVPRVKGGSKMRPVNICGACIEQVYKLYLETYTESTGE